MPLMDGGTFREWLAERVGDRDGQVSIRRLARLIADQHPDDGDVESHRRSLRRILKGERSPRQPYRDSIQDALDDHSAPSEDDDAANEATQREMRLEQAWQTIRELALGGN